MLKLWRAHHHVHDSRGRVSGRPHTGRGNTRGGHTSQHVAVRICVVEQGQIESYCSPEENKSQYEAAARKCEPEARRAPAGRPQAMACHTGGTTLGRRLSVPPSHADHASLHWVDWLADAGHVPAAACSARAKRTVSALAVAPR